MYIHFFSLHPAGVCDFYSSLLTYLLGMRDTLLAHAQVIDPSRRTLKDTTFASVEYFAEEFPCLTPISLEAAREEFATYQVNIIKYIS